jgi:hypothetical protein
MVSAGRSIGKAEGYIAATAAARGLMVTTRDMNLFEAAGLKTFNPWETSNNQVRRLPLARQRGSLRFALRA